MRTLLIKNAKSIVTMNDAREVVEGGSLYAVGQEIVAIGKDLPYEDADTVIDASGKIVFPGLINTHHHLFQTLTRNIPLAQECSLFDWLGALYDIWRHMRPEDVYIGAVVGLGELLKTGCTTAADHFYCFPDGISGELIDEEIRAAGELGIRFYPTRGSMTLGRSKGGLPPDVVCQTDEVALKDTVRVIERYHSADRFAMVRVGVAPCAPFNVTSDMLRESAALARSYKVRMHTHLAETLDEEAFCLEKFGVRPLEYMERHGWVGDDVWFAHGIHFHDGEISRLGKHSCGVAHCPSSNMKLSSGVLPLLKMQSAGVRVGLGVDGSASNDGNNMLTEARMAYLLHKLSHGADSIDAADALALGTRGSASVLGWEDGIGSLEIGKAADLFLIDTRRLEFGGALFDDMALPIVTGMTRPVDMTIVGGKVVVEDGRLIGIDEELAAERAQAAAQRLVNEATLLTGIDYRRSRRAKA
ncbi:8-oxoguanine deaminase [Cohnella sp. REN36]|uniref:8-oxoguanine deaminase n=1 Tax=Cohnella sp. REN36 TaxID=2887347 RepID=UPI001D13D5D3|nr:8-oxoguanine deaminase [Cohnella sp. REN36]MCC3372675.1 8-oxoguanine deaminase [Cohnella sp. REN36]